MLNVLKVLLLDLEHPHPLVVRPFRADFLDERGGDALELFLDPLLLGALRGQQRAVIKGIAAAAMNMVAAWPRRVAGTAAPPAIRQTASRQVVRQQMELAEEPGP